jgi:hypothetical protein
MIARIFSTLASVVLAIYLFGYEPSKNEGFLAIAFGFLMAATGYFVRKEVEEESR